MVAKLGWNNIKVVVELMLMLKVREVESKSTKNLPKEGDKGPCEKI